MSTSTGRPRRGRRTEHGGAHDQGEEGDVDVCAHRLGEERVARHHHECRERSGGPAERLLAEQEHSHTNAPQANSASASIAV